MLLAWSWNRSEVWGAPPPPPCRCYLSWLHTQTHSHINLNATATITAHSHKYTPQLATITQASTLWRPVVAVTVPCDQNGAQILIPHYARFKQPPLSLILSLYSPAPPQTPVSLSWPTQGPLDRSSTTAACVCVFLCACVCARLCVWLCHRDRKKKQDPSITWCLLVINNFLSA